MIRTPSHFVAFDLSLSIQKNHYPVPVFVSAATSLRGQNFQRDSNKIMYWHCSICVMLHFYKSGRGRGWRRWNFFKIKIKIVTIFSYHYVKSIILKELISLLIYYILRLFRFCILSFNKFILVFYVFKMYHFDLFLNLKVNKTLMFLTKYLKND